MGRGVYHVCYWFRFYSCSRLTKSLLDSYHSLGTTRAAAGSAAAFEKIDKEYVRGSI